ncbi:MAG: indolepyruvate oxidoreductase subunit beta [Sedimentisphaerales bacterium]|nr:indolepyruvate oxidoreductase subunit beta [Sedimentisphaerales bacterium]
MKENKVTNVVFAGLGGQGVLKASDIMSEAAFATGHDVKKSEIHGMSQRGGSVSSDVRFGEEVFSPMVPSGKADYLIVLSPDQVENNRAMLKPNGVLITPDSIDISQLPNKRSINVALLGVLSSYLEIDEKTWKDAIHGNLSEKLHEINDQAFALGRQARQG